MATKSVSWSIEKLFEADTKDAFDSMIDLSLQSFTYQHCPRWINTVKSSQERESGTDYSRNGNQISELKYWKIIWSWLKDAFDSMIDLSLQWFSTSIVPAGSMREKLAKNEKQGPTTAEMATKSVSWSIEKLFEADSKDAFDSMIDLSLQWFSYQHCPRWIYAVKSSQERESGTDYSRNGNQSSKKHFFTTAVTAWSIWNELDLDEKDWPTRTEVTAKSVNRNNEWWFEDYTTGAGDSMEYANHKNNTILPLL